MVQYSFWFFAFIILYVYFGYPLVLIVLAKAKGSVPMAKEEGAFTVSLIIAAYNEEKSIAEKIRNSLGLNYRQDRLEIIIGSDGSTDGTNEIATRVDHRNVRLVAECVNRGKSAIQNKAVAEAKGEILFFTDANVMLKEDALRKVTRHFADKGVGCVVGKVTYLNEKDTSISEGEGFYWRYELFLREKESLIGNLAMGSGPIMAVRRSLFRPLDPDVGEDFVLPMQVAMSGYRVVYESEAVSEETLCQNTPTSMFKSKVRVISKDLRGLFLCRAILNPFCHPLYAWALVSHKLLRWLAPYFLIALFALNLWLLSQPLYHLTLEVQLAFYALAVAGYLSQRKGKPSRVFGIPLSFCLVNLAALVGVVRFLIGKKAGKWEPVR